MIQGSCTDVMKSMPSNFFHCAITSPPYWNQRDYAIEGQLGLEESPEGYIETMVGVFAEVRRVLRDDGIFWLNIDDSYSLGAPKRKKNDTKKRCIPDRKKGNLLGIPWRLAMAMQEDGWYLRSAPIWYKNDLAMPENVYNRPFKSYEFLFMFTKMDSGYYFDYANPAYSVPFKEKHVIKETESLFEEAEERPDCVDNKNAIGRNRQNVWPIMRKGSKSKDHKAAFPEKLVEPMIGCSTSAIGACPKCGKPFEREIHTEYFNRRDKEKNKAMEEGGYTATTKGLQTLTVKNTGKKYHKGWKQACACHDVYEPVPCNVLDPFSGTATTGRVAYRHGCNYFGIEINRSHIEESYRIFQKEFGLGRDRLIV